MSNTGTVEIGKAPTHNYFKGDLDEVALYGGLVPAGADRGAPGRSGLALLRDHGCERPLVTLRVVAGVAAVAEREVDQLLDDRRALGLRAS